MPLDDETKRIIEEEWSLPKELPTETVAAPSGNAAGENCAPLTGSVEWEEASFGEWWKSVGEPKVGSTAYTIIRAAFFAGVSRANS